MNEDIMLRTRAYENGVYVAHVHPVNTFVVDPERKIVAQNRGPDEGIVLAKITVYHYTTDPPPEQHVAATIWDRPPAPGR